MDASAADMVRLIGSRVAFRRGWKTRLATAAGVSVSYISRLASGDFSGRVGYPVGVAIATIASAPDPAALLWSTGGATSMRDPEIEAMETIRAALSALPSDARMRVVAWMQRRFTEVVSQ